MTRLLERAAACCMEDRCGDAIDLLEAAVRETPASYCLHQRLGFCYSGGCRAHPLSSPELAIGYLRHALSLAGPSAEPVERARILDALGNTYARAGCFVPALECHREAAAIYDGAGAREEWGREEYNAANVSSELGRWSEAVLHYRNALQVRTRERDPRRWAAVLQNLGAAYRQAGDCRAAIDCCRLALRVYTVKADPARNAALHNNLGNAYLSMPGNRNARRALRHLERALEIRTRAAAPADYAVTQFNRGTALVRLLMPGRAAACFREASECFAAAGQSDHAALAHALAIRAADAAT